MRASRRHSARPVLLGLTLVALLGLHAHQAEAGVRQPPAIP